jgi:hypothetical protein
MIKSAGAKMTLTINIPQEIEQRLKTAAMRLGLDEAEYATRLIEQSLPPVSQSVDQATLDLLASWDAEDLSDDPAELARRERDWTEFSTSMNKHSLSARRVYP